MQPYEQAIKFAAENYFLGHDDPTDSDFTSFIAFIYQKDELRVVHDIRKYLKNRDKR